MPIWKAFGDLGRNFFWKLFFFFLKGMAIRTIFIFLEKKFLEVFLPKLFGLW